MTAGSRTDFTESSMLVNRCSSLRWTIVLPTYRRPDTLRLTLERLAGAIDDPRQFEVLVYDNGAPHSSESLVREFEGRLPVRYTLNEAGHGLGYSLQLGAAEALGEWILELNDDALVPPDLFERLEEVSRIDRSVGIIGVRAEEIGYQEESGDIGGVDSAAMRVVGNFTRKTDEPIDVDHVYGFCYAYRRRLLEMGGCHDRVLLARDYSSGNRIETDQCLTAKRLGFRVLYDGRLTVKHLAKPRGDMNERSLRWKLNSTRNTLYLFLKHYGLFGRQALALRFFLLHDVGIRSALLKPSQYNWSYFLVGLRARLSAFGHWFVYLLNCNRIVL